MKQETVEIQKELFDQKKSALKKYQELIIGQKGLWKLIKYEFIITCFSWIPGALGLVLRMKLYPKLLGKVGRNVTFGQNVVLRHPHKIEICDNVVIDDNVVLDAKGQDNLGKREISFSAIMPTLVPIARFFLRIKSNSARTPSSHPTPILWAAHIISTAPISHRWNKADRRLELRSAIIFGLAQEHQ